MIRNVCIHVQGEQPLLCDVFELPTADDAGLLCMNVRSLDGKRPVFIDQIGSTFFFPYHVIRFLEIPEGAMAAYRAAGGRAPAVGVADGGGAYPGDAGDDAYDPAAYGDGSMLPIVAGAPGDGDGEAEAELEIDEDVLQRIRDI